MQQTIIDIESLDMEARGVGHLQNEDGTPGKVVSSKVRCPKSASFTLPIARNRVGKRQR